LGEDDYLLLVGGEFRGVGEEEFSLREPRYKIASSLEMLRPSGMTSMAVSTGLG
jgi:hypothetical protein